MSEKTGQSGRFKVRFNIVDLLLTLLLFILIFALVAAVLPFGRSLAAQNERLIYLTLGESDASAYRASGVSVPKGTQVFSEDGGELLGELYVGFEAGDTQIVLRCAHPETLSKAVPGSRFTLTAGALYIRSASVTDVRKVGDYGKNI